MNYQGQRNCKKEIEARNKDIIFLYEYGCHVEDIARRKGLSKERIMYIVHAHGKRRWSPRGKAKGRTYVTLGV